MKHVEVVKAVEINGKLYTSARAAAKRWVEVAAQEIVRSTWVRGGDQARYYRAYCWAQNYCWVVAKRQRYWRRVLPFFERLLR